MLKIKLSRDLRKNILRGHPWVYRQAIVEPARGAETQLCQVLDGKNKPLAWAIYSASGPLALRILSTESKPPQKKFYEERMRAAHELRKPLYEKQTNAFRLFNGEGDRLPGMVCDLYNSLAVLQFDGQDCFDFWDRDFVAQWLLQNTKAETVYFKPRRSDSLEPQFWGQPIEGDEVAIQENGVQFYVDFVNGQKTGFFLDQRDNRQYVGELSKDKSVANFFSYTGGFSIYAGRGGAADVVSVDLAGAALDLAQKSWESNELPAEKHQSIAVDIFDFFEKNRERWDMVIVDPPSLTHSEKNKKQAMQSYIDLFEKAARTVNARGDLVLSSCSSHISFDDFFEIINEALSKARKTARIHRVSGQGMDHPFPHFSHELRYLKFVHLTLD